MNAVNRELLVCGVERRHCALPLEHVVETMRPLPVESLPGTPRFVLGVSIIRGAPVPVVDAAALLGTMAAHPSRFVLVRAGARQVALAVDAVLGVRAIPRESLHDLAPLLRDASAETIAAVGALEAALLLVLESARIIPESVWDALESRSASR